MPAKNLFYVSDIALVAKTFAVAKLAEKYKNLDGEQFRLQIRRRLLGEPSNTFFFQCLSDIFTEFCLTNVVLFVVKLLILQ